MNLNCSSCRTSIQRKRRGNNNNNISVKPCFCSGQNLFRGPQQFPSFFPNILIKFTDEERIVASLPSNAISPPSASPVVLVTQPQAVVQQEVMVANPDGSQTVAFQLSPQPTQNFQSQQVKLLNKL